MKKVQQATIFLLEILATVILSGCTQVKGRDVLDRIEAANQSMEAQEMRTDGYYWTPVESVERGKVWRGVHAYSFLPGRYVGMSAIVPAIFHSQRDTAPDSLNTFENAHRNLWSWLPFPGAPVDNSSLDKWGRYHANQDSIELGMLSNGGIGFPVMLQTIFAYREKGRRISDSAFTLDTTLYRFRKTPQSMDSSGLLLNTPKFKKKRFPGFFFGW